MNIHIMRAKSATTRKTIKMVFWFMLVSFLFQMSSTSLEIEKNQPVIYTSQQPKNERNSGLENVISIDKSCLILDCLFGWQGGEGGGGRREGLLGFVLCVV